MLTRLHKLNQSSNMQSVKNGSFMPYKCLILIKINKYSCYSYCMSYKISEEGNVATVHLDGEIDMDVTEKAKEVIMPLIEAGKEVHLNLKEVQYMDSSGISVLIESHQKAAELGTKVILKEISKSVLKVIMMAKLEQILIIE